MIVKYDNLIWNDTATHWHVSLDAVYRSYRVNSGTIKVKRNYGKNSFQSAISIAKKVALKRLRKQIDGHKD